MSAAPASGPIFVVGNSRSGTTMVARMLGRHPDAHTLRELHFFEELWMPTDGSPPLAAPEARRLVERLLHRARVGYNLPFDPTPHRTEAAEIVAAVGEATTAPRLYLAVMEREACLAGASRPVEQTPRNVHFVDAILDQVPDARVVAVVRDPRDVVLSHRNWWRRGSMGATEQTWRTSVRRFFGYHPVVTTLLWRSGVRASDAVSDARVLVVRFESVVQDPEAVVRLVCDHVGLDFRDDLLAVPRYNSSNRADPGGAGVDPSVVGAGARGLPPTERWIVQRLAHREMARHGYRADPCRPTATGLARAGLSLVPKVAVTTATNVRRSGSPWRSLVRRLRA